MPRKAAPVRTPSRKVSQTSEGTSQTATAAANIAVVITLPATVGRRWVVKLVAASYSAAAPTAPCGSSRRREGSMTTSAGGERGIQAMTRARRT